MNGSIREEIQNIKIEKALSIVFIIVGLANIIGDDFLIKSICENNPSLKSKSQQLFLFGLILALLANIAIVARNYTFYKEKKDAGLDASAELTRLFGTVLTLIGFILIFNYFIETGIDTELPPVL